MIRLKTLGLAALLAAVAVLPAAAASGHDTKIPERQSWSFAGPFGSFDRAQLQRGFKVFREVCSNCHSAKLLSFRNLAQPGGPEFSEAQVKALAAEYKVQDGPGEDGKMFERPARPADRFPSNYANPEAAKAVLGAVPPDMSVLAKARSYSRGFPLFLVDPFIQYQEHGVDYIYSLIAEGYSDDKNPNHNDYMPGGVIAIHISNRYLDLQPVVERLAEHFGLATACISDDTEEDWWVYSTTWMLVTKDRALLARPEIVAVTTAPRKAGRPAALWTDDNANLYSNMK
jgi:cytochrome c1